jgi:2,3-bisphosphoglycerate-dependent phosphoglycerate mutase
MSHGSGGRDRDDAGEGSAVVEILLIRHGETAWNAERRLQGQLDIPLNPHGLRQAQALADALRHEALDALFSSDLQRARQTAQAIGDAHGLPLQAQPDLRERCYGGFEGLRYDQIAARFPAEHAAWQAREIDARFPPAQDAGASGSEAPSAASGSGETLREFSQRAVAAVRRLARLGGYRKIAIVTHGGVLESVYREVHRLGHLPPRDFEIPNAAINRLLCDGDGWRIERWADVAHLQPLTQAALDEIDA